MLTNCPNCDELISAPSSKEIVCKKCKAIVFIGDPVKNEENRVIINNPEQIKSGIKENVDDEIDDEKIGDFFKDTIKLSIKSNKKYIGTPWDNMKKIGLANAFFYTTKELVFTPTKFFKKMTQMSGNKFFPPLYGVLFAAIGAMFFLYYMIQHLEVFPTTPLFTEYSKQFGAEWQTFESFF